MLYKSSMMFKITSDLYLVNYNSGYHPEMEYFGKVLTFSLGITITVTSISPNSISPRYSTHN